MNNYQELSQPKGYFDKTDPSLLGVYGLTRGSQNVLINDKGNIASRKGTTRFGQVGTLTTGIKSATTWETSSGTSLPVRTRYDALQAYYNGQYRDVLTGLKSLYKLRFDTWWDKGEIKDRLLFVNGSANMYSWTGGMSTIASWTATTISKQYSTAGSGTNTFTFSASGKTVTQTNTDFITLGFAVGNSIRVMGTVNNNGIYTIKTLTASVMTFSDSDVLVDETTALTTAIVGVLGKETWAVERFTTTGVMSMNIAGTPFTYNAGWNTNILTLTTNPSSLATVGGFVFQTVQVNTPVNGDVPAGLPIDIIKTNLNQVYMGYSGSRNVYLSKQSLFYDFGYTITVRKTGEGGTIFLDNTLVSIASTEDEKIAITAGKSDVYSVTFKQFSDGNIVGENIDVHKLKTSYGQSAISQDCFVKIKNGTLYLSNEPTIDFLGNVELIQGQQSKPLSDPIKRLIGALDKTNACGVYLKNVAFYLFPAESVLLMYDIERGFWQPPQTVSGSCLSVYNGNVIVHSAVTDESYTLFSGMTDNGSPISFVANTNVFTSGKRLTRKVFDEMLVEAIVNGNTNNLYCKMFSGYNGAVNILTFSIGFGDNDIYTETPALSAGMGSSSFGSLPFGSLYPDLDQDTDIGAVKKLYEGEGTPVLEAYVEQAQFSTDELSAYFEIVSWGYNPRLSGNSHGDIMQG